MNETAPIDDSTGKRIAKGCLLVLLFFTVLIAGSCWLLVKNKEKVAEGLTTGMQDLFELPYYGEPEYIKSNYGELLNTLDLAATNSNSHFTFASVVEGMPLPEEIFYVAIKKEEEDISVIKKLEWNSESKVIMGNYGAGSFNSDNQKVLFSIYQNSGPWNYMDKFVVYIKYAPGIAVPDS